jgi:hypothetical protein
VKEIRTCDGGLRKDAIIKDRPGGIAIDLAKGGLDPVKKGSAHFIHSLE